MNALLGKITKVRESRGSSRPGERLHRLAVSFKPVCIMPSRTKAPQWLKDQELKVTRRVADVREIGNVGDSLVLTPGESSRWLFPLEVEPVVAYGALPPRLTLTLRWWKTAKPGEFTVCANGRRRRGRFTASRPGGRRPSRAAGRGARKPTTFRATVATKPFFDGEPSLPVEFEVTFDKLKAGCTVLPAEGCCFARLQTPQGRRHRVESHWYAVDVCPEWGGGGIAGLFEKGRGVDHFRATGELIQEVFHQGGHRDRVEIGWSDKLRRVSMPCVTARRDDRATRLCLDGVVDEGAGVRTTVTYTVFDRLPLLLLQRDVLRHKPRKKDDKKDDDKKPAEPVDDMMRMALGFRAAYLVEKNARSGSRILSVDGDRFAVLRYTQMHERIWNRWRLAGGWAVAEHPARRECMLYLLDPHDPPVLGSWLGDRVVTLEPSWLPRPVRPSGGIGFAAAICAGELCGAGAAGAWVALRRPGEPGGVTCALVGRFRDAPAPGEAEFGLGRSRAAAAIERLLLPGVGEVHVASAHVPTGRMSHAFTATAGGIPARRPT